MLTISKNLILFFTLIIFIECNIDEKNLDSIELGLKKQNTGKLNTITKKNKTKTFIKNHLDKNLKNLINYFKQELTDIDKKQIGFKFKELKNYFNKTFIDSKSLKKINKKDFILKFIKYYEGLQVDNKVKDFKYKTFANYLNDIKSSNDNEWTNIINEDVCPDFNNFFYALKLTVDNSDLDKNNKLKVNEGISKSKNLFSLCLDAVKKEEVKKKILDELTLSKENSFKNLINFILKKLYSLIIYPVVVVEKKININEKVSKEVKVQITKSKDNIINEYKKYSKAVKEFLLLDPKGEIFMNITKTSMNKQKFPFEINQGLFTIILLIVEIKQSFGIKVKSLDEFKFENFLNKNHFMNEYSKFSKNFLNKFSQYGHCIKILKKLKIQIDKFKNRFNLFKDKKQKQIYLSVLELAQREYSLGMILLTELQKNKILAIDCLDQK